MMNNDVPKSSKETMLEKIRTGIEMKDLKGFIESEFSKLVSHTNQTMVDEEIRGLQMMDINLDSLSTASKEKVQKGIEFFKTLDLKTKLTNFDWNG
jgi:hypothetical protein